MDAVTKRYTLALDEDRWTAGWGEHYWIVDNFSSGPSGLCRLLPASEARREVERLNQAKR
jgi:hypothetical protein